MFTVPWFWYPSPSARFRSMIRMWYIIYLFNFVFMTIMPINTWHRYFYVGGSWTGNRSRPSCREVKFSWKGKRWFERKTEENWRREDEMMKFLTLDRWGAPPILTNGGNVWGWTWAWEMGMNLNLMWAGKMEKGASGRWYSRGFSPGWYYQPELKILATVRFDEQTI